MICLNRQRKTIAAVDRADSSHSHLIPILVYAHSAHTFTWWLYNLSSYVHITYCIHGPKGRAEGETLYCNMLQRYFLLVLYAIGSSLHQLNYLSFYFNFFCYSASGHVCICLIEACVWLMHSFSYCCRCCIAILRSRSCAAKNVDFTLCQKSSSALYDIAVRVHLHIISDSESETGLSPRFQSKCVRKLGKLYSAYHCTFTIRQTLQSIFIYGSEVFLSVKNTSAKCFKRLKTLRNFSTVNQLIFSRLSPFY